MEEWAKRKRRKREGGDLAKNIKCCHLGNKEVIIFLLVYILSGLIQTRRCLYANLFL